MAEEPDEDFDSTADKNSEMRYIAIELMKLAAKKRESDSKRVSFRELAAEFVQNVYLLKREIEKAANEDSKKEKKAGKSEKKGEKSVQFR